MSSSPNEGASVDLLPGAEPYRVDGGPVGVLVLHGFTGSPQSMRGLAEAFAAAGFTVDLPRLPGHGTTVDDMSQTSWSDWSAAADESYHRLRSRCSSVIVAGLSMGGTLAVWLAARHPEVAGLVLVNPAIQPAEAAAREQAHQSLAAGIDRWPAVGGDIAEPDQSEVAYDQVPVTSALSLLDALDDLAPKLASVAAPMLVFWSPQDHVVANGSSQLLIDTVSGPAELVRLERSYHVATLDFDREEIFVRSVAFARTLSA